MPDDALDVIAASDTTIADTQQLLAQTPLRLEETQRALAQTHRLGLRLQGFALASLGLSLLGPGGLVWQHLAMRYDTTTLNQAVLTNTQTIAAQTQVILERLRQP